MLDLDVGHLGRGGQQVVEQRDRARLAVVVVDEALVEHGRQPLHDSAADLALDDGRVDHGAAVLDHEVTGDADHPGVHVDLDPAAVRGLGPAAVGDREVGQHLDVAVGELGDRGPGPTPTRARRAR